jgi:hypothetical protein
MGYVVMRKLARFAGDPHRVAEQAPSCRPALKRAHVVHILAFHAAAVPATRRKTREAAI